MSIDLNKYDFAFLTSKVINYKQELFVVEKEKKTQQLRGNCQVSNMLWRIQKRISIFSEYKEIFQLLRNGEYFKAWCQAEQTEIAIKFLLKNFPDDKNLVEGIRLHIQKLQQLYPYRLFTSTVIVVKQAKCSICGQKLLLRHNCEHKIGKVYNGEMCCKIITDCELKGADIVSNPEHKYTVLFTTNEKGEQIDHYNYSGIQELMKLWITPFQNWDYKVTISYMPKQKAYNDDEFCPCGSALFYKDCCKDKPGIKHRRFVIG